MTAWILVQALVNIGAVLGILPITGVPLPLVSYGGSALVPTMLGLGMLLSFARPRGRRSRLRARVAARRRGSRCVSSLPGEGRPATSNLPSRSPTPCAVGSPDVGRDRAGHRARAGHPHHPGPRLRARADPAGPDPATPGPDLLRVPLRLRASVRAAADVLRRQHADVLVGLRRLRRRTGLPRGPAAAHPLRRARGEPAGRDGRTSWARGSRPTSRTTFPGTAIAHGRYVGLPIRRAVATLDRPARRAEARASFGLDPDLPTLLVTGGSQGARRLNEAAVRRRRARLRAAGRPGAARERAGQHRRRPDGGPGAPPYVVVPYLDRMELAYAAADLALCRAGANTVRRDDRGRPARGLRPPADRQRRAGADRRGRSSTRAAACWSTTPTARRAWVRETLLPLLSDPARLAAMGAAAARLRPPRRRRAARRPRRWTRSRRLAARDRRHREQLRDRDRPGSACLAEQLGHVHFIGIGGAGMSGIARIMLARGLPVSGSDAKDTVTLTALRALGATVHVGHAADHVDGADTVVISTAIRTEQSRARRGRRAGVCASSTAPGRWRRSCSAAGPSPWRARTARRRRPRC